MAPTSLPVPPGEQDNTGERSLSIDLSHLRQVLRRHKQPAQAQPNTRRYAALFHIPNCCSLPTDTDADTVSDYDGDLDEYLDGAQSHAEHRDLESDVDSVSDDESQWEYVPPTAYSAVTSPDHTNASLISTVSAAQEIAALYRAMYCDPEEVQESVHEDGQEQGICDKELPSIPDVGKDAISVYTVAPSLSCHSALDVSPPKPIEDLKLRRRRSDANALEEAEREALQVLQRTGLGRSDRVTCQRPGCYDTLHSLKSLTFHIHIHNIHETVRHARHRHAPGGLGLGVACAECGRHYECARELSMHACGRLPKGVQRKREGEGMGTSAGPCPSSIPLPLSPPMSPIRDGFRRVFLKPCLEDGSSFP
ncbi:hypothetical protein SERLA73DRAFT_164112 [Serpula lacrymans var. lacrymans S7.3]|uniref:Uncharacterized protein n=2 Tax=Serpula lacrymans var. lacrymans TaxID=341189 RepID=F8QH64_SERL3|nr:uncharacterized protein SERLADRAFT_415418 [Serpula lacrymans var. lacrymans S7.9]EGN92392.1 hypothetical protein SERLA73DRAFT_164112 [Serpula lacrymans var. lacrymans S7.3]EGO24253.1 hypothetical protein SERLADRAFT_415418 [Serpula lacrymans var. lacrymans S7.9]